jgi:four helix bundle protein
MARSIICERAKVFSERILTLCNVLDHRGADGRRVASELRRCGPSIGANANEAQEGQTKRDFIAKLSVSRRESKETIYWLNLAVSAKVMRSDELAWELQEANELRAMIVAAIKTAQSNPHRGRSEKRTL